MKSKIVLVLLLIAGIAYFLYLYRGSGGIKAGDLAPGFSLPTRAGETASLEQFRGKIVLLNLWATWCPSCLYEMPSLERLKGRLAGKDFQLLAVSLDEGGWGAIDKFLQKVPLTMTILLDTRGEIADRYGTYQLPESFLIDRNGVVVKKYVGPEDWNDPKIVAEIIKYVGGG